VKIIPEEIVISFRFFNFNVQSDFIKRLLQMKYRVKLEWIRKNGTGFLLRLMLKITIWFVGLSLFFVLLFKWVPVPVTPLMLIRSVQQISSGQKVILKHDWVPMRKISPHLQLAAVCSEDQNFLKHRGIDFGAMKKAVNESKKKNGKLRGASTISQQTAKNVFLWPQRSWVRKGLEVWFTGLIELIWGKKRILEVYLNSIEMGNGIYGVEAAANNYFGTNASKLTKYQSASIIAILPSPRKWNAKNPGPYVRSRIDWIIGQMRLHSPLPFNLNEKNSKKQIPKNK
jgi:monofunctional biosynthetic peptidoglycan transglycosylase